MENSSIQQIKDRLDIVEVVSSYLKLEKTGINLRACCPFHHEKKPSFFVSPSRQSFKCFGCGASGSIFDFVMKIEGLEFGDALRILAKRAGVELKKVDPQVASKRQRLYEILEIACLFFEKQMETGESGKKVSEYLEKRGLREETIKKWRLGYSPETWQGLSDFLISQGYNRDEILQTGLSVQSEKNKATYYDRFRGRIMFPVFDLNSQVVGFGARILEGQIADAGAKYINTPATELYDKSRTIYGLNFAKMNIRQNDCCILTEGYMDVILSHQAGFENTVAASGTALTQNQLAIIKRYTSNLLTAFDMDSAGGMATVRGIDLALENDFEVKVITMPQEKDPADVILENPKLWQDLAEKAQSIMDFYFATAFLKNNSATAEGKKAIANFLLPKIKKISNGIGRAHWIQKLANDLAIAEEAVREELKNIKEEKSAYISKNEEKAIAQKPVFKNRWELLEERIIALALKRDDGLSFVASQAKDFFSEKTKAIFAVLDQGVDDCLERAEGQVKETLRDCLMKSELEIAENPEEELRECLCQLKKIKSKEQLTELSQKIQQAQAQQNHEEISLLMSEFNNLLNLTKTV